MNVLKSQKKLAILSALLEGCSVRSTSRLTGSHIETILKLLVEVGNNCETMLNERMRDIQCEAIECDELWGYIGKKQKQVKAEEWVQKPMLGDVYTFIALEPQSKAVISYVLGKRNGETTWAFIRDLRERVMGSPQISTDGFAPYIEPIQSCFGREADYAQVTKLFAPEPAGRGRYSPPKVAAMHITPISGNPVKSKTGTSYVERNNLTLRMNLRRLTRLTNAFSRKFENLKASLSLWFWYYNFCRIHGSTKTSPALQLGITGKLWTLEDALS